MKRPIVIIGAGGLGREALVWARDAGREVFGFIDDRPDALAPFGNRPPVLGPANGLTCSEQYEYLVAIGDPLLRRTMARRVVATGGELATVVHPSAYVAAGTVISAGVLICPFSFISVDCTLGSNVVVNTYASIGHDSILADHVVLSPYSTLNGSCIVGEGAFFGSHCNVTPGHTVGRWSKIGAGAIVIRDVPDGALMTGMPANGRIMFDIDPA